MGYFKGGEEGESPGWRGDEEGMGMRSGSK